MPAATTIWRRWCGSPASDGARPARARLDRHLDRRVPHRRMRAGRARDAALSRIEPREVLVADRLAEDAEIRSAIGDIGAALTPLPAAFFDAGIGGGAALRALFGVKTMEAFGAFQPRRSFRPARRSSPMSRRRRSPSARRSSRRGGSATARSMRIDAATRANLELFRSAAGGRAGQPDRRDRPDPDARPARGCSPSGWRARSATRRRSRSGWTRCSSSSTRPQLRGGDPRRRSPPRPDMLRALSRLGARPRRSARSRRDPRRPRRRRRDRAEAADRRAGGLAAWSRAQAAALGQASRPTLAETLAARARRRSAAAEARRRLRPARATTPISTRRAALRDESRQVIAGAAGALCRGDRHPLAQDPAQQRARLFRRGDRRAGAGAAGERRGEKFIHRQTLASAMRFTTPELGELEQKIASAAERALAIELAIFDDLAARSRRRSERSASAARALAEIDVAAALAELAASENYVRPKVDASLAFEIEGGRHPVVEQALRAEGQSFVGNDCDLGPSGAALSPEGEGGRGAAGEGEPRAAAIRTPPLPPARARAPSPARGRGRRAEAGRIWLLTGPNMAGKSTFLRQNALIAILAQAGSFVPAQARAYRHRRRGVLAASARPTISRAGAPPSWWRWWRRRRS